MAEKGGETRIGCESEKERKRERGRERWKEKGNEIG